jgi:hypothetical protein
MKNKLKKTVHERPYPSPFATVVELASRDEAVVFADVDRAVDAILDVAVDQDPYAVSGLRARPLGSRGAQAPLASDGDSLLAEEDFDADKLVTCNIWASRPR